MVLKLAKREIDKEGPRTGPVKSGGFYSRKHKLSPEDIREIRAFAHILSKGEKGEEISSSGNERKG